MTGKNIIKIKNFIRSPKITLVIGLMLFLAGLFEISETIIEQVIERFLGFEITVYHGIIVFGLAQVFVSITHIFEGIENIGVSAEEKILEEELHEIGEKKTLI